MFLQILLANVVLLVVFLAISRIAGQRLGLGFVGIALIVYQVAFGYLSGRLTWFEGLAPLVGLALLVADMRGKLPRWTLIGYLRARRANKQRTGAD